jgi:hypothetical protein
MSDLPRTGLLICSPDWENLRPILARFSLELSRRVDRAAKLQTPASLSREDVNALVAAINHQPWMELTLIEIPDEKEII